MIPIKWHDAIVANDELSGPTPSSSKTKYFIFSSRNGWISPSSNI